MTFDMAIECTYPNGEVKYTYSSKYMRTALGRPVKVRVFGPYTVADVHAIRNSAVMGAAIEYVKGDERG